MNGPLLRSPLAPLIAHALALALACAGCPQSSSSSSPGSPSDAAAARPTDAAADAFIAPADAAPPSLLADAGTAMVPYTSKEGLYTVEVPAGVRPDGTISSIVWGLAGVTFAVSFYDGKPRGIDNTSFYDLARDKASGSDVEKEEELTVGRARTRAHVRRLRLVRPGKPVHWRRAAIVVVGDRTYQLSVMSPSPEDLTAPQANAFFDSFKLDASMLDASAPK
jgi:hypothetical protein